MLDPISGISATQYQYDDLDRPRQSTDPASGVTQYSYDADSNLTQVTDPNGNSTSYSYNELGDLLTLTSPDTGVTQYQYDLAGNRTQQTDARSVVANYSYDALNRLTAISYPSDSSLNITYTYDQGTHAIGRLTSMSDGGGSSSWTYDQQGRVTSKTQTVGSAVLTVQYAYNSDGQLDTITYPDGAELSYSHDIAYLPFGPISQFDYAGSYPDQDRSCDQGWRSTSLTGPLARTYTTDPVGNITAISEGSDTWHFRGAGGKYSRSRGGLEPGFCICPQPSEAEPCEPCEK